MHPLGKQQPLELVGGSWLVGTDGVFALVGCCRRHSYPHLSRVNTPLYHPHTPHTVCSTCNGTPMPHATPELPVSCELHHRWLQLHRPCPLHLPPTDHQGPVCAGDNTTGTRHTYNVQQHTCATPAQSPINTAPCEGLSGLSNNRCCSADVTHPACPIVPAPPQQLLLQLFVREATNLPPFPLCRGLPSLPFHVFPGCLQRLPA